MGIIKSLVEYLEGLIETGTLKSVSLSWFLLSLAVIPMGIHTVWGLMVLWKEEQVVTDMVLAIGGWGLPILGWLNGVAIILGTS